MNSLFDPDQTQSYDRRFLLLASFLCLITLFAILRIFTSKPNNQDLQTANHATELNASQELESESIVPEEQTETYVTMRSVGDILLHDWVYWEGQTETGYTFDYMLDPVRSYVQNADLTTANMETLVAGNEMGVSSYPLFNVPDQILDTLVGCGVDIVNNATNHSMDFGPMGVKYSIENIRERGLQYVGAYESWEDYNNLRILDVKGIKFGFLSYTYGTNGNPIPEDRPFLTTLLDRELIPLEIERMKQYADVVIVNYHFGEDSQLPVESELDWTQLAIDAGANFVLGGHSHIMQPMKQFNDHQAVWYSHGNFLSGQIQPYEKVGGIGEVTFKKDREGKITIDGMRMMPTFNLNPQDYGSYLVVPLAQASDYGIWNAPDLEAEVYDRFNQFDSQIKVVPYLD